MRGLYISHAGSYFSFIRKYNINFSIICLPNFTNSKNFQLFVKILCFNVKFILHLKQNLISNKNLLTAMDTKLLLPNRYKRLGWILFVPCLILMILALLEVNQNINFLGEGHMLSKWTTLAPAEKSSLGRILEGQSNDLAGEILMTLTAIGFFFVAFSRERTDDEWIMKVRLESLLWAFYVHLGAFFLSVWLSYSLAFYVFLSWNMLTAPLVFLARFHWIVYVKPYLEERRATA